MCLHSSIVKSCFSLAKYNNGLFKSEKQGTFLSQLGKTVLSTQTHNLGADYNFKVCGVTDWSITLDDQGVVKIIKRNAKGETVHFERQDQETFEKLKAEKETQQKAYEVRQVKLDKLHNRVEQLRSIDPIKVFLKIDLPSYNEDQLVAMAKKVDKVKALKEKRIEKLYNKISVTLNTL